MTEHAAPATEHEIRTPGGGSYPLRIGLGVLASVGSVCRGCAPAHSYAVISDSQVSDLYGERVLGTLRDTGVRAELFSFPAGESNKTRTRWAELTDSMLASGFGRDSAVVALGGGVTGDLAGFVAATYMRGVPVVQVPTSLLAMLDSSVGGKTGIDTQAAKNLVGAFHHPAAVVIDPTVLETLPRRERSAGLAEAVKTAAILDEGLWGWIGSRAADLIDGNPTASAELVGRVVAHKAGIVEEDPLDRSTRSILNFGHTVGHALEALAEYAVRHGEAVAAGMRVETRLGEALGITESGTAERMETLLEACGLERGPEDGALPEAVAGAMYGDKKVREATVRCVFLARIGQVALDSQGCHTFQLGREELGTRLAAALRPACDG